MEFDDKFSVNIWGHKFWSPIGVAEGIDFDGTFNEGLLDLGFGFVSTGTVTSNPESN